MTKIKTITAGSIAASCMVLLCGCDKNDPQISEASSVVDETSSDSIGGETPEFSDFVGEYPDHPISFLTDEEEIRKLIDEQPNFKSAENLYINIPESASLYEYHTYGVHVPQFEYPSAQFLEDFEAAFKYLFPDREINTEYFKYDKYLGYDSETGSISEIGFVKDADDLPDQITLTYDEMPERTDGWTSPIYMEIPHEIGAGGGAINKGEAAYIAGKVDRDLYGNVMPSDTYNRLADFYPDMYFPTVGKYTPQSEKSFKLLDGEMKICDAVKFVEDYINNIPISTGSVRNVQTSVYNVYVLQLGEDAYGYYFMTEPSFRGVIGDPAVGGSRSGTDIYDAGHFGCALMVRSTDVDIIHGICGSYWTFDVNVCEEVIPVETAIKAVSEKLTQSVTFEVISVDLVYVGEFDKDEQGYVNIDTYDAARKPAWRITAGNLNDNRTYICFAEAVGDGKFSYYSTPGINCYDD